MAAAYRVAAPSIRIVPWAARASCWPLPQQLLPVSATGGGRRRCTLAIISGKIIFNRAMPEHLRTLRHCIFTGRGRKDKRQLPRLLPAEAAARREHPFRLLTSLAATFPKGTALAVAGNFAVAAQRRPLEGRFPPLRGKMSRSDKKGNLPNAARLKECFGTTFFRTHFSAQIARIPSKLLKYARFFVR